jgi:SAM-dependent methyltransferase
MIANSNALTTALSVIKQADFDDAGYLRLHPDVALAVGRGLFSSGWDHFRKHGLGEGRRWVSTIGSNLQRSTDPAYLGPLSVPPSGVVSDISPQDTMFVHGDTRHYYHAGKTAVDCIEAALTAAKQDKAKIGHILDLPSGHGRVMRFIRAAFPQARLTACDLDADGVRFCAETFQATPVISQENIEAIPLLEKYDLIWCGSLLTHLPEEKCRAFLQLFRRLLLPNGFLIFTSHGRWVGARLATGDAHGNYGLQATQVEVLLREYDRNGFGYVDYGSHIGYGISLASPDFIKTHWLKDPDWRLLDYQERGWDAHQDVICLRKLG